VHSVTGNTQGGGDVISMPADFHRHLVEMLETFFDVILLKYALLAS